MKIFYQLKLDAILLPLIAILICIGGWAVIAGHSKITHYVDDWGDKATKTERFGISKNLPSPSETWVASKPYIIEPFAKRGELDQGILRFAWLSLKLVAQGYVIALLLGTPIGFFLGLSKNFTRAFDPIIQILRPVSPLAWLPLGMVLFSGLKVMDASGRSVLCAEQSKALLIR